MRTASVLALLFLALCLTAQATAQVVYVDCNSPGPEHDGTSWDTAFLTIQEGLDAATPGGEVWAADGVYLENVVMGEGVAIYSGFLGAEEGGYETELYERDWTNNVTAIDGNQSGSCVMMAVSAVVDGFTVTNGNGTQYGETTGGGGFYCRGLGATGAIANCIVTANSAFFGGGIRCYESSPVITNNTITGNRAFEMPWTWGLGGGIYSTFSSPTITGNTVEGNSAKDGGGVYCGRDTILVGNTITDNSADCAGGGVFCTTRPSTLLVAHNTISGNTARIEGGGVYCCRYSPATVAHNVIIGNSAEQGGGIACDEDSYPTVANNLVAGNLAEAFGGGINCYYSSANLHNNTICGNSAWLGGGAHFYCGNDLVSNNRIEANSASQWGGAVFAVASDSLALVGNVFTSNWAEGCGGAIFLYSSSPEIAGNIICENAAGSAGGALFCYLGSSPSVTNDTLATNSAAHGCGVACDSVEQQFPSDVSITNCVLRNGGDEVWNNDGSAITMTYSNVQGGWPGEGNIDADPMFVNPAAGDFHLTVDSPCIDAGTNDAPGLPDLDWDGEDRIIGGTVDMGADEYMTYYTEAPDPQPECDGPLFGASQTGFPAWVWFSIPLTPDCVVGSGCADPNALLGLECDGRLWYWDKYAKSAQVYQPPFLLWDLAVGDSYLLYLGTDVTNPGYAGITPFIPWTFEFKLGRQGWTWVGMPGPVDIGGEEFMQSVSVKYPSDETGTHRTAAQDYEATPDNWSSWAWPYWNTWAQSPETFTPYAPFGHNTCYPWVGYRVWVRVGTALDEGDPDQVTLVWPKLDSKTDRLGGLAREERCRLHPGPDTGRAR